MPLTYSLIDKKNGFTGALIVSTNTTNLIDEFKLSLYDNNISHGHDHHIEMLYSCFSSIKWKYIPDPNRRNFHTTLFHEFIDYFDNNQIIKPFLSRINR